MSAPVSYAILVAVGPDPEELERVADLIDSVRAYESAPCAFVMVDDAEPVRKLDQRFNFPANWTPISVRHPRRRFPKLAAAAKRGKGICAAILEGLSTIGRDAHEATFTLKMDTDALVIGPFVEKLNRVVSANPNVGMIGAYDRTPSGTPRDISKNAQTVRSLHRPDSLIKRITYRWSHEPEAIVSRHIADALKNGYTFGEHCLGGAYAVSQRMISRLPGHRYDDPRAWLPIDCPEDVMVGIYTKAVGCDFFSFVERNQVFGVRHRGLDDSPQGLLDRGYSVIHAVKNDPNVSEEEIRAFFRKHRSNH